ncbi:NAD(P)H-binding protein [soil metagenome]
MRVLLSGANGFIGGQLLAGLTARGHAVVAAVRDPQALRRKMPDAEAIAVDFNRDLSPETWRPRLTGIDAVINCAGVLQGGRGQDIEAVHATAPIALFEACRQAGVFKVVQISAISADTEVGTPYALTKKRADDYLRSLPLDWTVLRPSLVYGEGSYGGTSTLRGLAGLPLITPLVGGTTAAFRPIHIDDLVETVARVLDGGFARRTLEPVGPETLSLRDVVAKYRRWLGVPPAWEASLPLPLLRLAARLADWAGGGPMGSAGLAQTLAGNAGHEPDGAFAQEIGFVPASMDERLARRAAQTQDLWHARLYFLRPALRIALAAMWLGSAALGLLTPPALYAAIAAPWVAWLFSAIDLLIGLALVTRTKPRLVGLAQLVIVGGYTFGLTLLAPSLWLDPYGGLLKNLPILAAVLAWMALEEER